MTQFSRAVPETGVVEELRAWLREPDYAERFRLLAWMNKRPVAKFYRLFDALEAKDRELAEARAAKDGAYSERNQCVALIARFALAYGCRVGIAKTAIEGWDEAWHGCVYIDLPTGQVSWHYHDSEAHLFDFLPPYLGAWDGHTTPEKYERVSATFPIRPTETERERDEALAALREKEERVKALEADKARLDFLDACNAALNGRYGTNYGWTLVLTHNVTRLMLGRWMEVDLHDSEGGKAKLPSCRGAIDREMTRIDVERRARSVLSSVQPVSGSREQRGNEEG